MRTRSSARAALLAAAMNFVPAAPVDLFRFLRVPAIVLTIRQARGRLCRDAHEAHARRRARRRAS
jgi:hypothetical protein